MRFHICIAAFFVSAMIASFASTAAQNTVQYSVPLEGCPSPITLTIPRPFSHATSPETKALRASLLNALHANKARKARVSEIFLSNWESATNFPYIAVSSLGSLIQRQGNISREEWVKIRKHFQTLSAASMQSMIEKELPKYNAGRAIDVKTIRAEIPFLFEEGDSAIVIVGSSTVEILGHIVDLSSASKLAYTNGCVAFIQVAVDASDSKALYSLNRYMSQINVR